MKNSSRCQIKNFTKHLYADKMKWINYKQKPSVEKNMAVSYNNLWKLMINKRINKSELCENVKISSSIMAKMTNKKMVAMSILEKICAELDCNIGDFMEFIDIEMIKQNLHEDE